MSEAEKECIKLENKLQEKVFELKNEYNKMSNEAQILFNQKYKALLDLWASMHLLRK